MPCVPRCPSRNSSLFRKGHEGLTLGVKALQAEAEGGRRNEFPTDTMLAAADLRDLHVLQAWLRPGKVV